MSKAAKISLLLLAILAIVGSNIVYKVYNKPRRNVAAEKGIIINASQLVADYQANEAIANKKYLDKPVEVTGTIAEVKQNQEGQTTVLLLGPDEFAGVFCTLKIPVANLTTGAPVTIKGICHGMLSDVRIDEAILVP